MAAIVQGDTAAEAWKRGAHLLLSTPGHTLRTLITEIDRPTEMDAAWYTCFDPKRVGAADRMSVVSKVLFPDIPRRAGESRLAFYARCSSLLQRAIDKGSLRTSWGGTYFQRLISLDGSDNQIERAIRVLTQWKARSETAIVAHLSSPKIDGLRLRGSPCLQYIEILWGRDGKLDLVAVYRNHDFLNKTLGNFIGLGRLLQFIAHESGKHTGRVICHSVRAYTDDVTRLRKLLAQ